MLAPWHPKHFFKGLLGRARHWLSRHRALAIAVLLALVVLSGLFLRHSLVRPSDPLDWASASLPLESHSSAPLSRSRGRQSAVPARARRMSESS